MESLIQELFKIKGLYQSAVNLISRRKSESISGNLEIKKSNNSYQYYQSYTDPITKKKKRKYIKKDQIELAKKLAQKAYDDKVLQVSQKRLRQIDDFLKDFAENELEQIYEDLSPARKTLVKPVIEPYTSLISRWMAKKNFIEDYYSENLKHRTDRGELVRSKTEKILADKFFKLGISYKYEQALHLKNNILLYPDFTFIHKRTRKLIYWEHFGLMDDPQYLHKNLNKIQLYAQNGIIVGKNLIITHESSSSVLTDEYVNTLINEFLL